MKTLSRKLALLLAPLALVVTACSPWTGAKTALHQSVCSALKPSPKKTSAQRHAGAWYKKSSRKKISSRSAKAKKYSRGKKSYRVARR